jgi:thioredoxin 1
MRIDKNRKDGNMDQGELLEVTENDFQQVVMKAKELILVDFTAVWCGPCKAMKPVLKELQASYENELKIYAVDVDKNKTLAAKYGIRSIPCMIFFKNGKVKETIIGSTNKKTLEKKVISLLG